MKHGALLFIGMFLIFNPSMNAESLTPVPHLPPPTMSGNEPGATTSLGSDGSTTTTLTTTGETAGDTPGTTVTTTTTQTVTLNEDGSQTVTTTQKVEAKNSQETDQDGSWKVDTKTTTTTTKREIDTDGKTTTTTTRSGESRHEFYPADYDPESDDMYDPQPYDETVEEGWTTTTTDPDGNVTTETLEGQYRKTQTTHADDGSTTTTLEDISTGDVKSQTTQKKDGSTHKWERNKDGGSTVTDTAADGSSSSHTIYGDGRQETETKDKDGKVTEHTKYDKNAKPVIRIRYYPDGTKVETIFWGGKKWRSTVYDEKGKPIGVMFWQQPKDKPISQNMPEGTELFRETGDSTGIFTASGSDEAILAYRETGDSTGIFRETGDSTGIFALRETGDSTGIFSQEVILPDEIEGFDQDVSDQGEDALEPEVEEDHNA